MDWMKIGSALLLAMMVIVIYPRAKQMLKESPEGSTGDWMSALIPIGIVGLFIALLVMAV